MIAFIQPLLSSLKPEEGSIAVGACMTVARDCRWQSEPYLLNRARGFGWETFTTKESELARCFKAKWGKRSKI